MNSCKCFLFMTVLKCVLSLRPPASKMHYNLYFYKHYKELWQFLNLSKPILPFLKRITYPQNDGEEKSWQLLLQWQINWPQLFLSVLIFTHKIWFFKSIFARSVMSLLTVEFTTIVPLLYVVQPCLPNLHGHPTDSKNSDHF